MPFTFVCKFDRTPLLCREQVLDHFSTCHPAKSDSREEYFTYILESFDSFLFSDSFFPLEKSIMTTQNQSNPSTLPGTTDSNIGSSAPVLLSKTFFCSECNKPFHAETTLNNHKFKAHGLVSPHTTTLSADSTCDLCHKPFKNSKGVNRHKMLIHGHSPVVDSPADSPVSLSVSVSDSVSPADAPTPVPLTTRPNYCVVHNRQFDSFKAFNLHNYYKHPAIHQQMQSSDETFPHQSTCRVCGRPFKTPGGLKTHMGYKHADVSAGDELPPLPQLLHFRLQDNVLKVKKEIVDPELSDQPLIVWLTVPNEPGNYHGLTFSLVNGVFEFSFTSS